MGEEIRWMTIPDIARCCRVSPRTVEGWRLRGKGPPFFRVVGRVVCDRRDFEIWLEGCRRRDDDAE